MWDGGETGRRIWLIGGTRESAALAQLIAQAHLPCIITVTTDAARSLYPDLPALKVRVGKLASAQLQAFVQDEQIAAVLDASHPFAVEISQSAIAFARQHQLSYLRYERPSAQVDDTQIHASGEQCRFDSIKTLLAGDALTGHRVLLTLGYRSLPLFQPWHDRATLFARLLPSVTALEVALAAGFTSDRLMALRPPVSADVERALWQQWQISVVVTKASGTPGGEDVKRRVAAELGVRLIVIDRPAIDYPQQTSDLTKALEFCRQVQKI